MISWAPSVSSLYRNVELLASARSPRSSAMRLGLSWGFGLPEGGRHDLTEFSFPLRSAGDLPSLLRRRGGLDVCRHDDPDGRAMHRYLRMTAEPVIAVVDSFYLPYRPAYGRVHSSRTIIIEGREGDQVRVDDCWEPTYRGLLQIRHLEAARRSRAEADPLLEPVFTGVQGDAEWFSVSVRPIPLDDPVRWAVTMIGTLIREITVPEQGAGTRFGLVALRETVESLAGGSGCRWQEVPRRTLALTLRAELSSRRYLCPLLKNAATLAGQPALTAHVEQYQSGLRHFQAARDVLVKSLRNDRAEYDDFILARCRDALLNEERLIAVLTAAGLPWVPVPEEAAAWRG